ncbi:hypothetical protein C8R44DRAFT_886625 [Mycena epipterygia]|nr:hypothetical protein C8R44DRAFT_886625 [Mycena epipterygia]
MQRSFIVLLLLGLVRATLQNFTVDDTSPDIQYSEQTFQCNTTTCPDEALKGVFNSSVTLTNGSITFVYAGSAVHVFLDVIGACSINVDGIEIGGLNVTLAEAIAKEGSLPDIVAGPNVANGHHTLVIAPLTNRTIIAFDHLIYTATLGGATKSTNVGAIVGGVIGGIVLTVGALFAALYARRRKLILRRNQRKSAVLRGITAPRPDYKVGADDGAGLPT